jgi:hypothetical protein
MASVPGAAWMSPKSSCHHVYQEKRFSGVRRDMMLPLVLPRPSYRGAIRKPNPDSFRDVESMLICHCSPWRGRWTLSSPVPR